MGHTEGHRTGRLDRRRLYHHLFANETSKTTLLEPSIIHLTITVSSLAKDSLEKSLAFSIRDAAFFRVTGSSLVRASQGHGEGEGGGVQ